MQTDTPNTGRREIRRYALVAFAITLALFVLVPIFRKSPATPELQGPGVIPIRIVTADAKQTSPVAPALQPAVIVHAIAHTKSTATKALHTADASVSPDQAGGTTAYSAEDQAHYEDMLYNHIAKYLRYPHAALHVCPSGTAHVRFQAGRQGQLLSIVVEQSSGCAIIDNEAVETLRRAQPLPPVPAILPELITVHMPLSFGKS